MSKTNKWSEDAHLSTIATLAKLDLNLLLAFDVLAHERSVTRAAGRMGVTQSAMSHTLRRLRETLDDPLLIRGKGGMLLTPRAQALVVPVRQGLLTLGRAVESPEGFDPATSTRAFRLAAPDLFAALALPSLLSRVRREAPGTSLACLPHALDTHALELGELDLVVTARIDGASLGAASPGLMQRGILEDTFSCFLRADHDALRDHDHAAPLSLATFVGLPHVVVSPRGKGPGFVDVHLSKLGLERQVVLRLAGFYAALDILAHSDLVLTAPTALARLAGPRIATLPAALPLPGHTVALMWHERFTADPGHRWLRELVAGSAEGIMGDDEPQRTR